jgi:hypothetical protein
VSNATDGSPEEHERKTPTQARQSMAPGIVRYVVGASLALRILAFTIVYLVGSDGAEVMN